MSVGNTGITSGRMVRGTIPARSGAITGFYLQDTWRVTPRLTMNAGVRSSESSCRRTQRVVNGREVANPIDFGWGDKIAARIGAAWDVTGSG